MGSFLGIKMDQHWMDLFIWEGFFNAYDLKLLIEFGTGNGGMSTYLALQCLERNIKFLTFDNVRSLPIGSPVPELVKLPEAYAAADVFADETKNLVAGAIGLYGHPICLFFDNGMKPKEWETYMPFAAAGDFLVVHDWETEFKSEDAIGPVTRLLQSEGRNGYKTAWFRKDG